MKKILILSMFLFSSVILGQESKKENVKIVYKYKQHEEIDLGDLEIKGQIIAPGDLSVVDRARGDLRRRLFNKGNFNKEVRRNIQNLR